MEARTLIAHLDGTPRGRDAAAIEARGTALGSLGLLAFAAVVAGELRSSAIRPEIQQSWIAGHLLPNHHAPAVLLAAAAAWFAASILFWRVRELIRRLARIAPQRNAS
jgi:hypothetical protein